RLDAGDGPANRVEQDAADAGVRAQLHAQLAGQFRQRFGHGARAAPWIPHAFLRLHVCDAAHMQTQEGVWYPRGGTRAVPEALAKLAGELGVELRTHTGVRRILFDPVRRAVTGVET